MLSLAREGGDGLSRIEVHRIRKKDPQTGEEYDGVFYNESYDKEGTNICHQPGDRVMPTAAVIQESEASSRKRCRCLAGEGCCSLHSHCRVLGEELYHMEAEVGSETPPEEPRGIMITRMTMDWLEKLNEMQAEADQLLCPNSPEFLLVCIKQTNCLLETAAESQTPTQSLPAEWLPTWRWRKRSLTTTKSLRFRPRLGCPICQDFVSRRRPASPLFPTQVPCCNRRALQRQRAANGRVAQWPLCSIHTGQQPGRCVPSRSIRSCICWRNLSSLTPGRRQAYKAQQTMLSCRSDWRYVKLAVEKTGVSDCSYIVVPHRSHNL